MLMCVQRWILQRIVGKAPVHSSSYAYQTGKCIRECAEQHLGSRWMIKLDLHDFFHSIDERQVYSVFLRLGYQSLPAFEMARICTRQASFAVISGIAIPGVRHRNSSIAAYTTDLLGFLPQGAPTSGAIANLVTFRMDERIAAVAADHDLTYTRYADDIVLSGSTEFSRSMARQLIYLISDAARQSNLALHAKKTRIVPPGARHIVLGLLVDGDRVRPSKQMRMRLESHIYGVEKFGLANHQVARGFSSALGLARHIDGLLAFANDIDPRWAGALRIRWHQSLRRDAYVLAPGSVDDVFVRRYLTSFFD
jgi:RNA-directed DNA polymerase